MSTASSQHRVSLWIQTHQNILFFKSSFVLEYIHVESREWELFWIMRTQGLRTREITARIVEESTYYEGKFLFSSQWIPQQLVVCLEMIELSRTVAREPLPDYIMGISLASEKKKAASYNGTKYLFKALRASVWITPEANKQKISKEKLSLIRIS